VLPECRGGGSARPAGAAGRAGDRAPRHLPQPTVRGADHAPLGTGDRPRPAPARVRAVRDVSPDSPYEAQPGWSVKVTKRKLATPVQTDDGPVSEEVARITWTATGKQGAIAPGQFKDVPLSVQIPHKANTALSFKTLQTYSNGQIVRWIGAPTSDTPAPQVNVTPAAATGGHEAATPRPPPRHPTRTARARASGSPRSSSASSRCSSAARRCSRRDPGPESPPRRVPPPGSAPPPAAWQGGAQPGAPRRPARVRAISPGGGASAWIRRIGSVERSNRRVLGTSPGGRTGRSGQKRLTPSSASSRRA